MDNISKELIELVDRINNGKMTANQIARWAYSFSLKNKVCFINSELYDVLSEISSMDADEDSFLLSNSEVIEILKPFIYKEQIYYLYYPEWPNRNDISIDVFFPSLEKETGTIVSSLLFCDNKLYDILETTWKTMFDNITQQKEFKFNIGNYYIKFNLEQTEIVVLNDKEHNVCKMITIKTYLLYNIVSDYHNKMMKFPADWCPDIIVESDPRNVTYDMLVSLLREKQLTVGQVDIT